jgi:glycosyltransferase involved in cell wall biosynthesis
VRRVLLIGDYPPPYGGLSVQITSLRGQLAARGDTEVHVLDIGARRRERRDGCLPVRHPADLVRAVYGHARRGFTPHLHTNGHNRRSWIVAAGCAGVAAAGGRRAVVSLGSGAMPAFVQTAAPGIRALARTSLALARAVIVRNERARATLVALGVAPAKIVILPGFYGVAPDEIGVVPADVPPFRQDHDPLIGAISTSGPEYGIPLLIDAAARLKSRHPRLGVILVGTDRFEEACPPWVLAVGEQHRPALLAVMQTLDVFVRPTYIDGDASSVREALALGVRVVASATDFRPDGVWRAPIGDADALADTIETALAGRAVRAEWTSLPALLSIYDDLPVDRRPGDTERVHDDAAVARTPGSIRVG